MKEYIFTTPNIDGDCMMRYDQDGLIEAFEIRGNWTTAQRLFMINHLPKWESMLKEFMAERNPDASLTEVKQDLSFEVFWKAYNCKVGNKKRAEKLWNSMTELERISCLRTLPLYHRYLQFKKNMEQAYPETYLHQRRWESQYNYK